MKASLQLTWLALVVLMAGCRGPLSEALPYGADNETCASCHLDQGEAFARSGHGQSAESPVFQALLPHVEEAWGALAQARCVGCHAPSHLPEELRTDAHPGIACVSCHGAIGNRGTRDGRLVIDLNAPLDGPFGDAASPAHRSQARGFISDAQLCLTCHDLSGPQLFVEPAGAEYAQAVERVDAPTCIACHMPPLEPGPIALGSEMLRPRRSHAFVGPTPPLQTDAESLETYASSLRALFGEDRVRLEVTRESNELVVRLTNARLGHDLPTGSAFLRSLRVDVRFDEAAIARGVIELGDVPQRGGMPRALPTDADRIEHNRIAPGESREARIPIPEGARLAHATLSLRAYRDTLLDALSDALSDEERARLSVEVNVLQAQLALR